MLWDGEMSVLLNPYFQFPLCVDNPLPPRLSLVLARDFFHISCSSSLPNSAILRLFDPCNSGPEVDKRTWNEM